MTPPLVTLHGFTGRPANWDKATCSLGVAALHLSPLGHAPSATAAEASIHTWDDELTRLGALLPAEPVHLAGYSLGARLALGLALAFPARIARLTLVSGHTGLTTERERIERRAADARWCELLEGQGIEAFVNAWEGQPLFATQAALAEVERQEHRARRLAHDPRALARSLRATGLAEMPDYAPRLAALAVPVTLVAGELDAKFLGLGRVAAARLQAGRLVVAPNAGHDLLLERPDLVALVLREAYDGALAPAPKTSPAKVDSRT
jgi:2-succinyl-6-hydroxy-2,4-cyclohexadiene-1-carboxylate synthase